MVIGTVTIARPASLPVESSRGREQNVFEAGDGSLRVRDRGPSRRFLTYKVRMTKAEKDALETYLEATARWRMNTFTVTDDWSDSFTVRYWGNELRVTEKLGRYYEASLTFRVEDVET